MPVDVRTIDAGDAEAWVRCMTFGFLYQMAPGEPGYRLAGMDLDRTWGAFADGTVVGTLRSFATPLTVPGPSEVPAAALTNVTVAPTHRRQGLLRDMITRDLRAAADRG